MRSAAAFTPLIWEAPHYGNSRTVSEADPEAGRVVREVDVPGEVDAVAYDPALHRIYANEDDGATS
jgi:hypothetical protein